MNNEDKFTVIEMSEKLLQAFYDNIGNYMIGNDEDTFNLLRLTNIIISAHVSSMLNSLHAILSETQEDKKVFELFVDKINAFISSIGKIDWESNVKYN